MLRRVSTRLLLVGLFTATVFAAPHCAADESADYRGLKFSVAKGGDALLVPVGFAGRDYLFAFDTGCTATVFDESFREKLGDPLRTVRVETTQGETSMTYFKTPPATIAGWPLRALAVVEVGCVDLSRVRDVSGHKIYGLLGMDFIRGLRARIDFDAGELTFLESLPDDSGVPIRLTYSAEHGRVTARVDVEGAGEQDFMIDTGNLGVGNIEAKLMDRLLDDGHATALGDTRVVSLGTDEATVRAARLGELALGRFRHRGLVFTTGTRSALGSAYLSRYVVTLDFPAMTMYLKPGARLNEPSLRELSGLDLWRPGGATTVHSVADGSPAQRAGLMAGDVIEKIGPRAAASMSVFEIRKLFARPGRHTLWVAHGDKTLEVVLVLEETPLPTGR